IDDDCLSGYTIPGGSTVYLSVYTVQRSPEFWMQAEDFLPERFQKENPPVPFTFLPFGAGQRKCVGSELAMAEIVLTCAKLLSSFDVQLAPLVAPVVPHAAWSLRPKSDIQVLLGSKLRQTA